MKQSFLIVVCNLLLIACSAYNHIHSSEENGLKTMSLIQTPEVNLLKEGEGVTELPRLKVNTAYQFEEKVNARPLITLTIKVEKPQDGLHDSIVYISLDGENIPLFALEGRYVIPENLWVPIIHSQNIQYFLDMNHDQLVFKLNDKQKDQLTAFFNRAIQQRDQVFPAIPPGMKKW